MRTKAQNALARAIADRRREIAEETAAIRALAKSGTPEQRRLAARWLALC